MRVRFDDGGSLWKDVVCEKMGRCDVIVFGG